MFEGNEFLCCVGVVKQDSLGNCGGIGDVGLVGGVRTSQVSEQVKGLRVVESGESCGVHNIAQQSLVENSSVVGEVELLDGRVVYLIAHQRSVERVVGHIDCSRHVQGRVGGVEGSSKGDVAVVKEDDARVR